MKTCEENIHYRKADSEKRGKSQEKNKGNGENEIEEMRREGRTRQETQEIE